MIFSKYIEHITWDIDICLFQNCRIKPQLKISNISATPLHTKVYNCSSEVHLHKKVYRNFYRLGLILCQIIGIMEIQGGLSKELKRKTAGTKVAVIGNEAVDLIESAVKRMGFINTVISTEYSNLPACDMGQYVLL